MTSVSSRGTGARRPTEQTSPAPPRDRQRSAFYQAEHLVHRLFDRAADHPSVEVAGSHLTLPVERRFADQQSIQSYVDAVLLLGWVRHRWAQARQPVTIRERAGSSSAHYERDAAVIAVPGVRHGDRWALRELVVLHELAHHLAPEQPHHGPLFVGTYFELVDGVLGAEAAFVLRVLLLETGVAIG